MASRPWFNTARGTWLMKYRPDPTGPWVTVSLCKHPTGWDRSRPPKKPPQVAIDRAAEFAEIEYRARHGLAAPPARSVGLEGYMTAYLAAYESTRRVGSVLQVRRHVREFLAFCAARGVTTVQGVTRAVCRDFLESRAKSVSTNTLRTERGFLIGIFSRAVEDGIIPANPWHLAKVPGHPERSPETFWGPEEIERIASACSKPWQGDLVRFLAATGFRISTALLMRRDWIDWDRGIISIPRMEGVKTSYVHVMSTEARELLGRLVRIPPLMKVARISNLIFPYPGSRCPVSYNSARAAITRAIHKAGVKPGTVHDLRHSYARALMVAGVPPQVVMSQLGHKSLAMTLRYSSADEETVAQFVRDADQE